MRLGEVIELICTYDYYNDAYIPRNIDRIGTATINRALRLVKYMDESKIPINTITGLMGSKLLINFTLAHGTHNIIIDSYGKAEIKSDDLE